MTAIASKMVGDVLNAGNNRKLSGLFNKTPYGGFSAGGLTSSVGSGGQINVTSNAERQGYVQSIADLFRQHGTDIRQDILPQVAPGMGRLTAASSNALNMRRDKSISTLSENLSKRRVQGSNFAMNAMGNVEAEYGKMDAEMRADNFMKELMLTEKFRSEAYANDMKAFNVKLNELNLQYGIADKASTNLISALSNLQQLEIGAVQDSIAGNAKFAGELVGSFSSLFSSGGGGGTNAQSASAGMNALNF